uniref:Uncharacterized protein n=1 Tax=Oryza barthii TaxID=65489 RepID=A0A0D3G4M1_9ORYZ
MEERRDCQAEARRKEAGDGKGVAVEACGGWSVVGHWYNGVHTLTENGRWWRNGAIVTDRQGQSSLSLWWGYWVKTLPWFSLRPRQMAPAVFIVALLPRDIV